MRKFQDVVALEPAVVQSHPVPFLSCPGKLAGRLVDSMHRNFRKSFRQTARIKTGPASQLDQLLARAWFSARPESADHPFGVVPEKFFAAENVKPGELLEQTVRRSIACFLAVNRSERRRPDCLAERQSRWIGERG